MILNLHERVKVGAVFEGHWPRPVWFALSGDKVVVKNICYKWRERKGDDVLYNFTITDGDNLYELSFSSRAVAWYLVAIDEGGVRA